MLLTLWSFNLSCQALWREVHTLCAQGGKAISGTLDDRDKFPILGRNPRPQASDLLDKRGIPGRLQPGFCDAVRVGKDEAKRSFREAVKRGPNSAIRYWSEAWSWGSHFPGPALYLPAF